MMTSRETIHFLTKGMCHSGVNCLKWQFAFCDHFNEFYLCISAMYVMKFISIQYPKLLFIINASSIMIF